MKLLKNIIFIIIVLIITFIPTHIIQSNLYINSNAVTRNQVNVAVLVSDLNDPYISLIKQDLEDIQKKNENKVKFTFFDAKSNQSIQDETLDTLLRNNINLFLVNLVDTKVSVIENTIDKVKQKNIPLLLFNAEPPSIQTK